MADRESVMAFVPVCTLDDLWEGEMKVYEVEGRQVLMVNAEGGFVRAFDAHCPHQMASLEQGALEGLILICPAHSWEFDVTTGEGVNPLGCRLTSYPVQVEADQVFVDLAG
jgi:toluene monooxygenase system ferredoxin subunit